MDKKRRVTVNVPVGVERVLFLAGTDSAFRRLLHRDRQAALADPRVRLRRSEHELLLRLPQAQLDAAVDTLDLSPENVGRRRFLQAVAATAVAATVASCSDDGDTVATDGVFSSEMKAGVDVWAPGDTVPTEGTILSDMQAGVDVGGADTIPVDAPFGAADAGVLPDGGSSGGGNP